MRTPSMRDLPAEAAACARALSRRLRQAGHEAWLVGGTVRDLALERAPHDVDLATDATPDRIEELFEHTVSVGKAFGTIVVRDAETGRDVQITTFRSEEGYSDARRPDSVRFGSSAEEDARRRDFTCNALYLDPLDDRLLDPTAGLADLEAGVLRPVGDAQDRFREDGLRLVRLARFAGTLGLSVPPEVRAAARACRDALSGVAAERVLDEWTKCCEGGGAAAALELLDECALLDPLFPTLRALAPANLDPRRALDLRLGALGALATAIPVEVGLAVLFDPSPGTSVGPAAEDLQPGLEALEALRPSRLQRRAVQVAWQLLRAIEALFAAGPVEASSRATRLRLVRNPLYAHAMCLTGAWRIARGAGLEPVRDLAAFASGVSAADLNPEPLLESADFERAGLPRGALYGRLLRELETLQLDGAVADRAAAEAWLERRARELDAS